MKRVSASLISMGGGGAVLIRVWVLRAARSLTPARTPNFDVNLVQNIGTESIDSDWFSGGRRRVAGSAKKKEEEKGQRQERRVTRKEATTCGAKASGRKVLMKPKVRGVSEK